MSSRIGFKNWAADGVRFILAGVANTLITLAIYQLLLFVCPPWVAYSFSWLCGLLFVVIFYPSRVFVGARRDLAARARLGGSYVVVFLLGLGTLRMAGGLQVPPRLSIFAVLAVTTAANFLLGRWILGGTVSAAREQRNG